MTVRDDLSLLTPRLRRYARALTAGAPDAPLGPKAEPQSRFNDFADDLVHATVLRALNTGGDAKKCDLTLHAYALLTQLHRENMRENGVALAMPAAATMDQNPAMYRSRTQNSGSSDLLRALAHLKLDEREALLLVAVEQFSYADAMHILHVSRTSLVARLARARAKLGEILTPAAGRHDVPPKYVPHLRLVK